MKEGPIILDSPIEFAVIGPAGGQDRVLVKSRNAGLDLIGVAVSRGEFDQPKADLLSVLIFASARLNLAHSSYLSDLRSDIDQRESIFSFSWKGFTSSLRHKRIEKAFDLCSSDLHKAIKNDDISSVELAMAPVILLCASADERVRRRRRLLIFLLGLYAGVGIVSLIGITIRQFLGLTV